MSIPAPAKPFYQMDPTELRDLKERMHFKLLTRIDTETQVQTLYGNHRIHFPCEFEEQCGAFGEFTPIAICGSVFFYTDSAGRHRGVVD